MLFVYPVNDSERYGVVDADERGRLVTKSAYGSYLVQVAKGFTTSAA